MATYGTITALTMSNPYGYGGDNKVEINWTSDTGGDAGKVTCDICSEYVSVTAGADNKVKPTKLTGFIVRVVTNPGATAPTDNYDIVLNDEDGVDVMSGTLANRDTANSEDVIPSDPPYVDGELTLVITSAGDSKIGKITIYLTK